LTVISSKKYKLQHLEENNNDNNTESQPIVESQPTIESQSTIEPQSIVTNLFVTKYRGRSPKRLKSTLEDITNTHQNSHNSNNIILNDN
ncbi:36283_t:CDS:1, partial [Racocetra persica]